MRSQKQLRELEKRIAALEVEAQKRRSEKLDEINHLKDLLMQYMEWSVETCITGFPTRENVETIPKVADALIRLFSLINK